jgi:D-alanyl-D-alanine carboxypeptidase (penicillin-binding protein 5/6)
LIVTQMGSTTGDWEDTAALLDWGFANAGAVVPVGRLVEPGEAAPPRAAPTASVTGTPLPASSAVPAPEGLEPPSDAGGQEQTAASVVTWGIAVLGLAVLGLAGSLVVRRRSRI